MKRADQVLALRCIDAGLAADGRIDLGEKGGRHLHHADAAPEDACGEAGKITDDPAAERTTQSPRATPSSSSRSHRMARTGKLLLASPGCTTASPR